MKKTLLPLLGVVLLSLNTNAATLVSAGSGNWNTAATWLPAQVPTSADSLVVQSGHVITTTTYAYCLSLNIQTGGTVTKNGSMYITRCLRHDGSFGGLGTIFFNGPSIFISGSTTINVPDNWSIVGTATIAAGTVVNKNGNINLSSATVTNLGNLNLNGGTLNIPAGSTFTNASGATLAVFSTIPISGGTLNTSAANNTVIYNGNVGQIYPAGTYHHLILAVSGTKLLMANTQVNGNFTINGSAFYNGNGFTLSIRGNWTNNNGGANISNGDVTFNGAAAQTISKSGSQENFRHFTIASSNTVQHTCNILVAGNLTISSGTLDVSASNRTIYCQGTWLNSGGTFNPRSGMVIFLNSGAITVSKSSPPETFFNFRQQGGGTTTLASNIDITGTLDIMGGTLAGSSFTINLSQNWNRTAGTFSPGSSTVNMIGTGARTITALGTETFNNLSVNKTGGGSVTLASPISCSGTFILAAGCTFDVSASNHAVTIAGNTTLNGTFNTRNGNVTFNRSAGIQIITSTAPSVTFYDITVNCTGLGIRTTSGTYNITNSVIPTSGMFQNTGATVTLTSSGVKTAIIAAGNGTFFGNFILQRFISARPANWHDFGVPVQSTTLSDWDGSVSNEMYMSGVGGPDGNACCPTFYSVNIYDEAAGDYSPITDVTTILDPTLGYQIFLGDDLNTWTATRLIDSRGTPNSGTQSSPLSFTIFSLDPGANLIGNPFHAHVDWNLTTQNNVDPTIYMLDNNGNYQSYSGSVDIPPLQGFFVYALGPGASVDFPQTSKTSSTSSSFNRIAQPNFDIKLKLTGNSTEYSHEVYIDFNSVASKKYNVGLDARYVKSPIKDAPSMSMIGEDNILTTRNTFAPTDYDAVPLRVKTPINGTYTIDVFGIENANQYTCIILEDLLLNKKVNLKEIRKYTFESKSTNSPNRFVLHLIKDESKCNDIYAKKITYFNQDMIKVLNNGSDLASIQFDLDDESDAVVSIYNTMGQLINTQIINAYKQILPLTIFESGMYIVTIQVGPNTVTNKIIINK